MRLFDERRRAILMSNNFRGYARTVSGNPVTLADCMNDYPVSVSVSGNTVQDGTPTPETPIEMHSCGDRTANLFDAGDKYKYSIPYTVDDNGWISVTFNNTNGSVKSVQPIMTNPSEEILPNTQYLFVIEIEELTTNAYLNPVSKETDYGRVGQFLESYNMETTGIFVKTITSREDLSIAETMLRSQIMVEAGQIGKAKFRISVLPYDETITADNFVYEPFGYKVPVKVSGVNLFDVSDRATAISYNKYTFDDEGWITLSYDNTNGTSTQYPVALTNISQEIKPNTTYKLICEVKEISGCTLFPCAGNSWQPGQFATNIATEVTGTLCSDIVSLEDMSNATNMLRTFIGVPSGSNGKAVFRLSVIEDTSVTPETFTYESYHEPQSFNIYTKEPINGNASVADVITVDVDSKTCTDMRNFFEYEITGAENISIAGSNDNGNVFGINVGINRYNAVTYYCNKCSCMVNSVVNPSSSLSDSITAIAGGGVAYVYFFVPTSICTTVAEFKEILAEQYTSGTPYKVICRYNDSAITAKDISVLQNWDSIPKLNRGTNIITAETEVEPSAIEVNYYADKTGA